MVEVYGDNSSIQMENYRGNFPILYYHALPSCIPDDIKHKILELHFINSVNTIINIWRKNLDTIRYSQHLRWVRMIYNPKYVNTDNIPLLKRQNAMTNLLA